MRILVINPNISDTMSETIRRGAVAAASSDTEVTVATAAFGVAYLTNRSENAIAAHATLAVLAERAERAEFHGAVIAAFTDTGLGAARELVPFPVVGIAEAGMRAAAAGGRRFAVVTAAMGLIPVIGELAHAYGLGDRFLGVYSAPPGSIDLIGDLGTAATMLAELANQAVHDAGAEAIVLGGAPFTMLADDLRRLVDRPVFEGVAAAIRELEEMHRAQAARPASASAKGRGPAPPAKAGRGVSPALAQRLGLQVIG
jgi:Asp/Glu/hydantoin racemase